MDTFLSKLLPVFIYPLGASLALLVLCLILSGPRTRVLARRGILLVVLWLWTSSTPIFANFVTSYLEGIYPPRLVQDLPEADAIILLGGIVGQPLYPRLEPDIGEAGDRVLFAWRLYRAGKASRVVIAAGNLSWQTAVAPEAELLADLLVELGVPRSSLIVEASSANTLQNAVNTALIFEKGGWKSGLLVTSGLHMPRAVATFNRAGLDVTPAATDIRVGYPLADSVLDFLPDAGALARTTAAMKELIGLAVYRVRNWA